MRARADQLLRAWGVLAFVSWLALVAIALGAFEAEAGAAEPATKDEPRVEQRRDTEQTSVNEVSRNVMCPSCEGTLDQSNSPAAERMRAYIEEAVAAGWTEEEIRDGLVEEYDGDESILATPRASGIGLLAWIVPALVVLAMAVGGFVLIRSWRGGPTTADATSGSSDQTRSGSSSYSQASASASPSKSEPSPSPSTGDSASSSR